MLSKRSIAYNNLAVMLHAGVPILKALRSASTGLKGKLPQGFRAMAHAAADGDSLADTMTKHPDIFPPLDITMVQVGEISGNLAEFLDSLAKWYQFGHKIKTTICNGMWLPIIVLHTAAFVPYLPMLFMEFMTTREYLKNVVFILSLFYIPTAVILAIIYLTPKTGPLRTILDNFAIKIPLLGKALRHLALSRFCQAFHMLTKTGMDLVKCSRMALDLTGNAVVRNIFKGGADSAKQGNPVSLGFTNDLPMGFLEVWQTGEETGTMEDATQRLAETYADSAQRKFEYFAVWFPRVVYVLVSIIVFLMFLKILSEVMAGYSSI